ncbi:MAG TPA: phage holin family protein [Candidatus Angelobacter sp.]|nr:phage holin family protein [Candidatus Angelobacter sp.]
MHTEKSLATLLAETREELKEFVTTRLGILKAEIDEKISTLKSVVPLLLIAAALLLAGWMALTFALIALLHGVFLPSPFAWLWGALIVGGAYLALAIAIGWFAYGEITSAGITPTRTLRVLKQDQVWLQNEARTA